ncbi:MAG: hypothetical protein ABJC19_09485, partial [Gemmatimonadota bacterium]
MTLPRLSTRYLLTFVCSAFTMSACHDTVVAPASLVSITVTGDPGALAIGATQQFTATGRDANGSPVAITPVWTVEVGGGTINGTGLFTAGTTAGTFTNSVTATVAGVAGSASVTVTAGALTSISVTPNPVTLAIGATQQFTATGRDASGNVIAMVPVWSVVAGGGTINGTGLFSAGTTAGTFTNSVTATVAGV